MGDEHTDIALAKVLTDFSNMAVLNIEDLCLLEHEKLGEDSIYVKLSRSPTPNARYILLDCKTPPGAVEVMKALVDVLKVRTQLSLEVVNDSIEEDDENDKGYHITQSVKLEIRKEFYDRLTKFQEIEEKLNDGGKDNSCISQ